MGSLKSFRRNGIVFLAAFLFLETYWIFIKQHEAQGNQPFEHDYYIPLKARQAVGQIFLTRKNHLSRVRLFLFLSEQSKGIPIEFHLQRVGRHGKEYTFQRLEVEQSGWVEFRFPPVEDSKGNIHHFYIIALEEKGLPVNIAAASNDPYPEGHAYGRVGRNMEEGSDLHFEFYYSSTVFQKLDEIVAGKPFVFGSKLFLMLVFGLYNIAFAGFFIRLDSNGVRSGRTAFSKGGV